jgi:hypothetical protein
LQILLSKKYWKENTTFNTRVENTFKLALYTSAATLNSSTTVYPGDSTGDQVADSGQYAQGGGILVKPNPSTSVSSGVCDC